LNKPCFDFVMTNPPFYGTLEEASDIRKGDGRERTDMITSEGVYPGGEVGFVIHMIEDSLYLRQRISWYTSMVGKKSSLNSLVKKLRDLGFGRGNIRTTEFVQGKMNRWGLAWTFLEIPARLIATRVSGIVDSFHVQMDDAFKEREAEKEVFDRIYSYCQHIKDIVLLCSLKRCNQGLKVTIVEELRSKNDEFRCHPAETASYKHHKGSTNMTNPSRLCLLPKEGHFLIDVMVQCVSSREESKGNIVQVTSNSFSHSARGNTFINRILSQMEGDVTRSNRKWRRIKKRKFADANPD